MPLHHIPAGSTVADYHHWKFDHCSLVLAQHIEVEVPATERGFRLRNNELLLWMRINNDRGRRMKTLKCDKYPFVEDPKGVLRTMLKVKTIDR